MKCPYCSNSDTKVIDSRNIGNLRRRRRHCTNCEKRFTTTEFPGSRKETEVPLFSIREVRKNNGKTEDFDEVKLKRSLEYATRRLEYDSVFIEEVIDQVKRQTLRASADVVKSRDLLRWTFEALLKESPPAARRYAAIYLDEKALSRHLIKLDKHIKNE